MACSSPGKEISPEYIRLMYTRNVGNGEMLEFLNVNKREIIAFMNNEELDDDTSGSLIHLIACATHCESVSSRENVLQLLQSTSDTKLLNNKGAKLLLRSSICIPQFHSYNCLLKDFTNILQKMNFVLPTSLECPNKIGLISLLQKQINGCDELGTFEFLLTEIDDLQNKIIGKLSERSETACNEKRKNTCEDKLKPPENFRHISVMPEESDLIYQTAFLRRNKIYGKYASLEHYLDVQFRLYREDFIIPLREVYEEFLVKDKEKQRFRLDSGRIYRDVKILQGTSTSSDHGEVFIIELDKDHCGRIRWNNSRRLIFGSLLLMSFDRFKSIFFIVVAQSDRDDLRESGRFQVQIFRTRSDQKIPRDTHGILLEATSAYFEAYQHVLTALQSIQEDTLPFQKYIVHCNSDIDVPKYLTMNDESTYDLQPILSTDRVQLASTHPKHGERIEKYNIEVLDVENWPPQAELGMDESQRKAFISALTKEFVLIQGPPGTGKTYIGLQIAKTLLHNSDQWKKRIPNPTGISLKQTYKKPCILVVCYTNHALDQFVEGIIKFLPLEEDHHGFDIPEVVRIGSRCKNEEVDKYSIRKLRYKVHKTMHATDVLEKAKQTKDKVLRIRAELKIIQSQNTVVHFRHLSKFMSKEHSDFFHNDQENVWQDWIHVSTKSWIEEVQKSIMWKNRKPRQSVQIAGGPEVLDIVTEAEYAYSERSLDEDADFRLDSNCIGIDVNQQLNRMLHDIHVRDTRWRDILQEESDTVLKELKSGILASGNILKTKNLKKLALQNRWKLYRYWLKQFVDNLKDQLQRAEIEFNQIFQDYKKAKAEVDEKILEQASVIAVTTTGAAKYHESLMKIGPQVTIIEEAAEVPEAHIVTAINPDCEHVILIGDHKQLEPKPAVLKLATRYNLSISLFERMLKNGLHYNCLQRQHRMRPEISELVRHIYPVLDDNENVYKYENIKGVQKNLFFITHDSVEEFSDDIKSYSNEYEAEYMKELCSYLLKQGYQGSEITIIAAYTGQMFLIRSKMPRSDFEGVNICVLDNYQGEENEIILLSLVRSNINGEIGFLKRENRICVALSRAKKGLYITGNSSTLTKNSNEWKEVIDKIKSTKTVNTENELKFPYTGSSFGEALPLYCQNHPEKEGILAKLSMDFSKAPDGGCDLPCEMRLKCGHVCRRQCHPLDKNHENYVCKQYCPKICKEEHYCHKQCHFPEDCNCEVMMERTLDCDHKVELECYKNPEEYKCQVKVRRLLPCDHSVHLRCYEDFREYKCRTIVTDKRVKCKHEYTRMCYDTFYETVNKCKVDVEKTFPDCGHEINLLCYKDILLEKCKEDVVKQFDCGHSISILCYEQKTEKIECTYKCLKECQNGHMCQRTCHFLSPCSCEIMVDKQLPKCGHIIPLECYKNADDYQKCPSEVLFNLSSCGHKLKVPCYIKEYITSLDSNKQLLAEKKIKCKTNVDALLPSCGHMIIIKCWQKAEIDISISTIKENNVSVMENLGIKCLSIVGLELKCGHLKNVECWKKIDYQNRKLERSGLSVGRQDELRCTTLVQFELKCGHAVEVECWKKCQYDKNTRYTIFTLHESKDIECKAKVEVELLCGHKKEIECHEKQRYNASISFRRLKADCNEEVEVKLERCGHIIKIECQQRRRAQDMECKEMVDYTYPQCGHNIQIMCRQHPNFRRNTHPRINRYYWQRSQRAFEEVDEIYKIPPCDAEVKQKLPCGHELLIQCHLSFKSNICNEKCLKILLCGHSCVGFCKTCQESIKHKQCKMVCGKKLVCGHECPSINCMQCLPCINDCQNTCEHASCQLKCKDRCQPCTAPCSWVCPHFKCQKLCYEKCDRPICLHDCDKILKCGHKCSGFCGEPCPISCRICNSGMFMNIKSDQTEQTVTIRECGHSFGYAYLDEYMKNKSDELITRCPSCQTQFYRHPRYNAILKRKMTFTEEVKKHISDLQKSSKYFPVFDSAVFLRFDNYIANFLSYLQIAKYVERQTERLSEINTLEHIARNTRNRLSEISTPTLQSCADIGEETFRIYIAWILYMISGKRTFLQRRFDITYFSRKNMNYQAKDTTDSSFKITNDDEIEPMQPKDVRSELPNLKVTNSSADKTKSEKCYAHSAEDMNIYPDTSFTDTSDAEGDEDRVHQSTFFDDPAVSDSDSDSVSDVDESLKNGKYELMMDSTATFLTGEEMVQKIREHLRNNDKNEVDKFIDIILPFLRDDPHFSDVIDYPKLEGAVGLHEGQWKVCPKGHLTPSLASNVCFTCSDIDIKIIGKSQNKKIWKKLKENVVQSGTQSTHASWRHDRTLETGMVDVQAVQRTQNHGGAKQTLTLFDFVQHGGTSQRNRGRNRNRGQGRGQVNLRYASFHNSQRGDVRPNFLDSNFERANVVQNTNIGPWNHPRGRGWNRGQNKHPAMTLNNPQLSDYHEGNNLRNTSFNNSQRGDVRPNFLESNFERANEFQNTYIGPWNHQRGSGWNRGQNKQTVMTLNNPQRPDHHETTSKSSNNGRHDGSRGGQSRGGRQRGRGRRRGGRNR